jgi:hypothetical protein
MYVANLRLERPFGLGGSTRIIPSLDLFSLTNANTILSRRRIL